MKNKTKQKQNEPKSEGKILSVFCFDAISISDTFISATFFALARQIFSEETMESLREYGEVLRGIHRRLLSEGYVFSNGKFYRKDDKIDAT